jgi:hypothetical protein
MVRALIIVIDEYAVLTHAHDAIKHADSIARRGRAVAVNPNPDNARK